MRFSSRTIAHIQSLLTVRRCWNSGRGGLGGLFNKSLFVRPPPPPPRRRKMCGCEQPSHVTICSACRSNYSEANFGPCDKSRHKKNTSSAVWKTSSRKRARKDIKLIQLSIRMNEKYMSMNVTFAWSLGVRRLSNAI